MADASHLEECKNEGEGLTHSHEELLQKVREMETLLKENKRFLNMAIHDLRSPTVSINQGLTLAAELLATLCAQSPPEVKLVFSKPKEPD